MTQSPDHDARISRLEVRVEEVAADKVDANRRAINALGAQTRERFDAVDRRFDALDRRVDGLETEMRSGFADMRHGFDQTAAGFARIAELIAARDDGR